MTVLVTGATGNVGSHVVGELRDRVASVRAFVRDTAAAAERFGDGVEIMAGDFADAASIERALVGVDRVFLSSADGPMKVEHEAAVIDAAAAAGARLIVKASTLAAQPGSPLGPLDWNGRSEEHLRSSGVPAVILGSGFYMTNLLASAEPVRREGALVAAAGAGRIAMIDPRDTAAVAAVVLTGDGHAGRRYDLTGPDAIGYERIAAAIAAATGDTVAYVDVPEDALRENLVAAGLPDWLVVHLVGLFRLVRAGAFECTTDTVRAVTGREPRSIDDFARDHAHLFAAVGARA
jgi:uncharacterized protein YbjT (DUF2867 family)